MELFRKVAHERSSAVMVVTHDHPSLDLFERTYEMEDGELRPASPDHARDVLSALVLCPIVWGV